MIKLPMSFVLIPMVLNRRFGLGCPPEARPFRRPNSLSKLPACDQDYLAANCIQVVMGISKLNCERVSYLVVVRRLLSVAVRRRKASTVRVHEPNISLRTRAAQPKKL